MLKNLTLALTYKCNSRCKICDIWKVNKKDLLSFGKIKEILSSEAVKTVRNVFLTGGEPFMRNDLIDIVNLIKQTLPESFMLISTNGLCRDEIMEFLRNCEHDATLSFSVDGIRNHDLQRGVVGAFKRTTETIRLVREQFPVQDIVFKFTITPLNYDEILDVYNLSKKYNARFHVKPVENLRNYLNLKTDLKYTKFSAGQILEIERQISIIRWDFLRQKNLHDAAFIENIPGFLRDRKSVGVECDAAENSITVMQDGDVYSCILLPKIGNVLKGPIDEIWKSEKSGKVRRIVRGGKCPRCMLFCGSYGSFGGG